MLIWIALYATVATAAAYVGFGGVGGTPAPFAKIVFFYAVMGCVLTLAVAIADLAGSGRRRLVKLDWNVRAGKAVRS